MTIPRRVVPGTTYLLTRRCQDRRFYLRPRRELNQIYLYALAHAQLVHGVAVHGFIAMSNHVHELVTDRRGVLPDFLRDLRREVALGAKLLYQIHGNVWTAQKPSAVELHGDAAQLDSALYVLLNPVRAGLVPRSSAWPGAVSRPGANRIEVRRPDVWFSDGRPDVLVLELTPPPAWTGTDDAWDAWLGDQLAAGEAVIARERRAVNKRFLGRDRVLQQRPFDRPRNPDMLVPSRSPTISTGRDAGLMVRALAVLREWRRAYREARERWRLDKAAAFPFGAWWVVQRAGATIG